MICLMPYLNTPRIRQWLIEHDKTVQWLAVAAGINAGTLKNAVAGRGQTRWGRVKSLAIVTGIAVKVLVKPGTVVPPWVIDDATEDEEEGVKEEKTHPDKRENGKGAGSGPKRVKDAASRAVA